MGNQLSRHIPSLSLPSSVRKQVWISPALGLLLFLTLFPLLLLVYISFYNRRLILAINEFVGLENYAQLIQGGDFFHAAFTTGIYVVATVVGEVILGVAIALYINNRLPEGWQSFFQTLLIIPLMMAYIAVGLGWRYMMDGSIGITAYFLKSAGFQTTSLLGNTTFALPAIILVDIWQWTPFVVLLVLAGLQRIPQELYEAAELDGAGSWAKFRYVTLPSLRSILLVTILFRGADAFRAFDKIWVLTQGGPVDATMVLSVLIYLQSFRDGTLGMASATSVLMLVLLMAGLIPLLRYAQRKEVL